MASIRDYHRRHGYADIAYHFLVEIHDGRGYLKRGRSDTMQGCHGNRHYNRVGLGFCVAGNYENGIMTEGIYRDVLAAVKHVLDVYPEVVEIRGHREVNPTACPGRNFPLTRLRTEVGM